MMGLGSTCVFTAGLTGKVKISITGQVLNSAAAQVTLGARYGTSTAPANAAAVAGTRFGSGQAGGAAADLLTRVAAAALGEPFEFQQVVTGLALGVPIWADLAIASNSTSNTCNVTNLCVTFEEMAA
jgi:hypothetical protein